MSTMTAIFENGVFRPLGTVQLPEHTRVEVELPELPARAEVSDEVPLVSETVTSASGRLVLAPTGIAVHSGKAVRDVRDDLARPGARR
jgi:predicted DNA-binding antitoxin AbrB/MazE fold protein